MDINKYHQDGYLLWTELHRAARMNQVDRARYLLEQGADPNLEVKVIENPMIDSHGANDEWQQSLCYLGKTSLDLARNIFGREWDRTQMRELLISYGGTGALPSV